MSARADVSPPSRIIDFKMTGTIDDSLYIQLEWSAPGDDYDRGRGKYHFRITHSIELILMSLSKLLKIIQNVVQLR